MTRSRKLLLAALFCAALLLRSAGLRTGLPSETGRLATFHPDESITFYSLERMDPSELDFYPGDSLYWGTFLVYTQGAVAKAMQLTGLLKLGDRDFIMSHLGEADKLYMSGRLISALFSAGTVLLVFLAGRRLAGERAALLSSTFFAFFYVNSWMGSIVKPDGIMLFWGTLSLYFVFRASMEGGIRNYLLAGVFIGLSAVSKYTGVVFALPVVLAWGLRAKGIKGGVRSLHLVLSAAAAAAAVYIFINPYILIRFSDAFAYMKGMATKGAWPSDPLAGYYEYLVYILPTGVGWPMFLLSLAGFFALPVRRSKEALIIAAFAAVYFLKFGAPQEQAFTYALPLTPFMALAAGALGDRLLNLRYGKAACVLVAAYTLAHAAYMQSFFLGKSTLTLSGEWLTANAGRGASVAVSKNDSWTPPAIRRYDSPYELREGGTSQGGLSAAIAALPAAASGADYLVLTEQEYAQAGWDLAKGNPAPSAALGALENDFGEAAAFRRPVSRFFMPLQRPRELVQVRFTQLDTVIFQKK